MSISFYLLFTNIFNVILTKSCKFIHSAELLGLPLIPAYSEASGAQVLHGVNYASATAGILDITGRNFVRTHISNSNEPGFPFDLNFNERILYLTRDPIISRKFLLHGQVGRIPFDQQIRNFQNTLDQVTDNLGASDVSNAIARCIFFVGMGSNDYLNNYLMPNYNTKNQYNAQQYADLLVSEYSRQLTVRFNFTIFTFFTICMHFSYFFF